MSRTAPARPSRVGARSRSTPGPGVVDRHDDALLVRPVGGAGTARPGRSSCCPCTSAARTPPAAAGSGTPHGCSPRPSPRRCRTSRCCSAPARTLLVLVHGDVTVSVDGPEPADAQRRGVPDLAGAHGRRAVRRGHGHRPGRSRPRRASAAVPFDLGSGTVPGGGRDPAGDGAPARLRRSRGGAPSRPSVPGRRRRCRAGDVATRPPAGAATRAATGAPAGAGGDHEPDGAAVGGAVPQRAARRRSAAGPHRRAAPRRCRSARRRCRARPRRRVRARWRWSRA